MLTTAALANHVKAAEYRPHLSRKVVRISTTVTNVGDRAGDEVVLAMTVGPHAGIGGAPLESLRHYDRISLAPGESSAVVFELSAHDLAEVSKEGQVVPIAGDWLVRVGFATPAVVAIVA